MLLRRLVAANIFYIILKIFMSIVAAPLLLVLEAGRLTITLVTVSVSPVVTLAEPRLEVWLDTWANQR